MYQAAQVAQLQVGPQVQPPALPLPSPVPSLPQEQGLQEQCSPQLHIVWQAAAVFTGTGTPPLLCFPAHLHKTEAVRFQQKHTACEQRQIE